MKKICSQTKCIVKKIIGVLLAILTVSMVTSGCAYMVSGITAANPRAKAINMPIGANCQEIDNLFSSELPGPSLPSSNKSKDTICTDYIDRGLIRICYKNKTGATEILQVSHGNQSVTYYLKGDGSNESFPLQFGNGKYTVHILKNKNGNSYTIVKSLSFNVDMEDTNMVFLNSVQNINWNYDMQPIEVVRKIVAGSLLNPENGDLKYSCLNDIYTYIVENIKYDEEKAKSLEPDYIPNIEETFEDNSGICYDYSSLLASMLRSIGIPAKLVKGYPGYKPDVYHAWNEVYVDDKWITIDTAYDAKLFALGEQITMVKNSDEYSAINEY